MELNRDDMWNLAKVGVGLGVIAAIYWKEKQDNERWETAATPAPGGGYRDQQYEYKRPFRAHPEPKPEAKVTEIPSRTMSPEQVRKDIQYMLNSS